MKYKSILLKKFRIIEINKEGLIKTPVFKDFHYTKQDAKKCIKEEGEEYKEYYILPAFSREILDKEEMIEDEEYD